LLSVMYHNLGATMERDQAAERHLKTEADLGKLEVITTDEEVEQILDVVADVGAALAGR
jgi:anaphase-promoting complex subunit 5